MDRVDELTCETTQRSHEERDPPLLTCRAIPPPAQSLVRDSNDAWWGKTQHRGAGQKAPGFQKTNPVRPHGTGTRHIAAELTRKAVSLQEAWTSWNAFHCMRNICKEGELLQRALQTDRPALSPSLARG